MEDLRGLSEPKPSRSVERDPDDSPPRRRALRLALASVYRRLLPWTSGRRVVAHPRGSTGRGEIFGLQRAMFGVRAAGTVMVLVIAPLAQRIDPVLLGAGLASLVGVLVVQAAWFRSGRTEGAQAVALTGLVGDSLAGYLVVQSYLASAEWVQYVTYPLMAMEGAVVAGWFGATASTLASSVVLALQFAARADLGYPTAPSTIAIVLGILAIYGVFMAVYAGLGRRMRADLGALLEVSALLAQQESPTRIVQALDGRLRRLVGARVRSVAVRRPDGTYEILRWRTPETRLVDLAAVAGLSAHLGRDLEGDMREGRPLTVVVAANHDAPLIEVMGLPEWVRAITLVPISSEGVLGGILPVLWDDRHVPSGAELDLLVGFAQQTGQAFSQAQLRRARELAATDSLTGLANHRAFRDALTARAAEARRNGGRLAILFCDVDRFKDVNDRHGHGVGDLVLHRIATAVRSVARTEDVVARYGGDELALLLPGADRAAAMDVGARLRERVRAVEGGLDIDLTVGVALLPEHGADPEILVARADAAMYAGKRLGGGRVVDASDLPGEG